MPIPIALAAIAAAQGLLGIGQSIAAGSKRRKAEQFFEKNKYEVPSGVKSMLDVVKGVASQTKMPGYENYLQQLQGTTSQGVEAATRSGQSSSDVLGALQGLYGRQMGMQQDLAISNAQDWQRNQFQYANALQTMGQYQTEKWNYNVLYPYMQKMTGAGQMAEAGGQNIGSAINSGINILGANWQMKNDLDMFNKQMVAKGLGGSPSVPGGNANAAGNGFSPFSTGNINRLSGNNPLWEASRPMNPAFVTGYDYNPNWKNNSWGNTVPNSPY